MSTTPGALEDRSVGPTREEMLAALTLQKRAYMEEGIVSAETRIDRIDRAIAILVDHQDAFADALSRDFGYRSKPMSRTADVMVGVASLKHAKRHLHRWMKPERHKLDFPLGLLGAKAYVSYQPKGVVGIISPWNLPVGLTFGPLADIFAAGNRVMIKPSEFTPETSSLMAELFAGSYDESEVTVFTGGPEVGRALSSLPFDHLLFTGGTAVGREVMRAAAENLVPVTLELGGKSPAILGRSVDMTKAADHLTIFKLLNSGQTCLSPDYVFVPRERKDELIEALKSATAQMYPKMRDNPDYSSVISERHRSRLEEYIDDARANGAEIVEINPAGEDFSEQSGTNKMPLSLVMEPNDDAHVMQDEIFGPVLPIKSYDEIQEAIDYVNAHPRPLALYYFGEDRREEQRVLNGTTSGGVTVNDVAWHFFQQDLPFGGVGSSGMGVYHGIEGFKQYSHAKSVYRQTRTSLAALLGLKPPYGPRLEKTLAREIKS